MFSDLEHRTIAIEIQTDLMLFKKYLCNPFALRPLNKIIFNGNHWVMSTRLKKEVNYRWLHIRGLRVHWREIEIERRESAERVKSGDFLNFYLWCHGHSDWQAPEGIWRQYSISSFQFFFFYLLSIQRMCCEHMEFILYFPCQKKCHGILFFIVILTFCFFSVSLSLSYVYD